MQIKSIVVVVVVVVVMCFITLFCNIPNIMSGKLESYYERRRPCFIFVESCWAEESVVITYDLFSHSIMEVIGYMSFNSVTLPALLLVRSGAQVVQVHKQQPCLTSLTKLWHLSVAWDSLKPCTLVRLIWLDWFRLLMLLKAKHCFTPRWFSLKR